MVVLPFTSMCYIHGWGNDREQCLFYFGHLFVQSRWVWPPLGCSHGSSFFLVVWSQLVRDSSIYCLLALLIRSDSLPLKLASYGVACHDFIHSLLWSSTLVFQSDMLMIIVYDVNNHIIVQSKIVLTACEVVNMFLFIIGLWSLSLTVASDVKLRTVVSEHWPYSQRLYCQTLCLSVIVFASLSLWLLSTIMCTAVLPAQVGYNKGHCFLGSEVHLNLGLFPVWIKSGLQCFRFEDLLLIMLSPLLVVCGW